MKSDEVRDESTERAPDTHVISIIGMHKEDDVADEKHFDFVGIFSDGSIDIITKSEAHDQYPFKVIEFYEKHVQFKAAAVSKWIH